MSITALKVNSILLQIIKWLRFKPSFRKTINYVYDGDENRIPNNHDLLSRTRTDCALSPEFSGAQSRRIYTVRLQKTQGGRNTLSHRELRDNTIAIALYIA